MQQTIETETASFVLERWLSAAPETVWHYWVDADWLAEWWAPPSATVTECVLEPVEGGRAILDYRHAGGRCRAEGRVTAAKAPMHLAFRLATPEASGPVSLAGHYDLTLAADGAGTLLRLAVWIDRQGDRGGRRGGVAGPGSHHVPVPAS